MDPITALGAAGSVVGIAGFGVQLAQILRKYLSQIWYAQESLEAIVEEIGLTTSTLEEIYVFLEQEVDNIKHRQSLRLFSWTSLEKVKATADKCLVIFWRVEATISGNWPAAIEDHLVKKLDEFNNKLTHYSPESPITIHSELTSDPLGLRDKLRWPNKASKLDKYCKQLQRYQDNLVLLLQVVSLGQQRLKSNPSERDTWLMLRTYEIIGSLASPQELQIIAWETRTQSQTRPGTAGREPSLAPSHLKKLRTTSRATVNTLPFPWAPASSVSRGFSGARPQLNVGDTSTARKPRSSSNGSITGGHAISSDVDIGKQQPTPPRVTQARRPLVHFSSPINRTAQQEDQMNPGSRSNGNGQLLSSRKINVDNMTTLPSQAPANNAVTNGQTAGTNELNACSEQVMRQSAHKSPGASSEGVIFNSKSTRSGNPEEKLVTPPRPIRLGESAVQIKTQSNKQSQDKENPESLNGENTMENTGQTDALILPYVLYEGGAYQLPVSLELDMRSKLRGSLSSIHSGKELTESLAFLNPGQVQTLQGILRNDSGDQIRKLAHLEEFKKSSMKFWRRPTKVTIAFIQGEMSNMPAGVGMQNVNLKLPQITTLPVPQQQMSAPYLTSRLKSDSVPESSATERLHQHSSRENPTTNSQQHDAYLRGGIPTTQTSMQTLNLPRTSGISGIQDVTALLLETEEWRERFTEYRVWTIRPFLSIEQRQTWSEFWDRCVITEEHLSDHDISSRLAALDKNPMTVLEKIATLSMSQQIQVQQSLEVAKSRVSDPTSQWKFRQLDIIRSKKWFRPKHVKRVIVYACIKPPPQVSKQPEESQREHRAGSTQPSSSEPIILSIEDKKHHRDESGGETNSTDSDDSSIDESKGNFVRRKRRGSPSMQRIERMRDDTNRHGQAARQSEVERANAAIASRPAGRPRPHLRSSPTSNNVDSTRPVVIINNRIYNMSDSETSDSDIYSEEHYDPNANVATGHRSAAASTRDRLRREYEWVERNVSPDSRSSSPRYRSRSVATSRASRARPHLLGFHTSDELRARTRSLAREGQTYPDEFDKQPYDPQLSPQTDDARQEAIEQLLLEWTPLYQGDKDSDNDDTNATESKGYESTSRFLNGQAGRPAPVMDEPELLDSAADQAAEAEADMKSEILTEDGASTVKEPVLGPSTDNISRRATIQPPLVLGASNDEAQPRPLRWGDRAATLPTPTRRAWTDPDWARQIVEETATVVGPDEYESPLRHSTAPQARGSVRQRGSEFPHADQERDAERYTSPTTRHHQNRSRVEDDYRDSLERRPSPPRRRRTVEFEGLDRPVVSRGRDRGTEIVDSRRSYLAESRHRRRSRSHVRDRAPRSETYVEQEHRRRSRSRDYRHPPRR